MKKLLSILFLAFTVSITGAQVTKGQKWIKPDQGFGKDTLNAILVRNANTNGNSGFVACVGTDSLYLYKASNKIFTIKNDSDVCFRLKGNTWCLWKDSFFKKATPGGYNSNIQFNSSGNFGGSNNFKWINATNVLNLNGSVGIGTSNPLSLFHTEAGASNGNLFNYVNNLVNKNRSTWSELIDTSCFYATNSADGQISLGVADKVGNHYTIDYTNKDLVINNSYGEYYGSIVLQTWLHKLIYNWQGNLYHGVNNTNGSVYNNLLMGDGNYVNGGDWNYTIGYQNNSSWYSWNLLFGYKNSAFAGYYNHLFGKYNYTYYASGTVALGDSNYHSYSKTYSLGAKGIAYMPRQIVLSNGNFSSYGDAQTSYIIARNRTKATTNDTVFLEDRKHLVLPAKTIWGAEISISACKETGDTVLLARRYCAIKRDGSNNTVLVGTVETIGTDKFTGGSWLTITITADNNNECLLIRAQQTTPSYSRVMAAIKLTELRYP